MEIDNVIIPKQLERNITISVFNAQLIRNKEALILDHLLQYKVDLAMVTETWLTDTDRDKVWLQSSDVNKDIYSLSLSIRTCKRGGGVGLIHQKNTDVILTEEKEAKTFQVAKWRVTVDKTTIHLIGVYKPPDTSNTEFLEEFTEWLTPVVANETNLIITGDFNHKIGNINDDDAENLLETTNALGFEQYFNCATHKSGNTLDLPFSEVISGIKIVNCKPTSYISDHCAMVCRTMIPKPELVRKTITYRNLESLDIEELANQFRYHLNQNMADDEYSEFVLRFNDSLMNSLDDLAPQLTKMVTCRPKFPWFTDEVRQIKHRLWRREKLWRKYREPDLWKAYISIRHEYKELLNKMKTEVISNKVKECGSDSQKLYALVNNLLGTKVSNLLPESNSDEKLAEEFAEFFLSKVLKIRDSIKHYPKYVVTDKNQPKLNTFRDLNEEEVLSIVMSMPVKHCDLDPIPATVMRKLIPHILQEITILVNQSLVHGDFAKVWKTSVCKPLITY